MQTAFLFRTGKLLEKVFSADCIFPEIFDKSFQKGKAPIGQVHQGGPAGFDRRSNLNFGSGSSQLAIAKNSSKCSVRPGFARVVCRLDMLEKRANLR